MLDFLFKVTRSFPDPIVKGLVKLVQILKCLEVKLLCSKIETQGPGQTLFFGGGGLKSPTNLRGLEYLVINVSLANSGKVHTPNQWR